MNSMNYWILEINEKSFKEQRKTVEKIFSDKEQWILYYVEFYLKSVGTICRGWDILPEQTAQTLQSFYSSQLRGDVIPTLQCYRVVRNIAVTDLDRGIKYSSIP